MQGNKKWKAIYSECIKGIRSFAEERWWADAVMNVRTRENGKYRGGGQQDGTGLAEITH